MQRKPVKPSQVGYLCSLILPIHRTNNVIPSLDLLQNVCTRYYLYVRRAYIVVRYIYITLVVYSTRGGVMGLSRKEPK